MPIVETSHFSRPPVWQWNGHLQTIVPGMLRRLPPPDYQRERINTPDDDFLDLDWLRGGNRRVVVLTHGLEGNSLRQYIVGTAYYFFQQGWDVLAWNCRSCSGEMNRQFRLYHHGDVEDIRLVVQHVLQGRQYEHLAMVGFSMGANITMKYLGVLGSRVPAAVSAAAVFSAPIDLAAAAAMLDLPQNFIYRNKFFKALCKKIRLKNEQFPGRLDLDKLKQVRRWRDFDEWFAAPVCGFPSADEFYRQASAQYFLEGIRVPTLLVNALNDPILQFPQCYPVAQAKQHPYLYLEMPRAGGHCGFQEPRHWFSWSERRAYEFIAQQTLAAIHLIKKDTPQQY